MVGDVYEMVAALQEQERADGAYSTRLLEPDEVFFHYFNGVFLTYFLSCMIYRGSDGHWIKAKCILLAYTITTYKQNLT